MNNRQKTFCREYIVDLNASAAYVRAGYSKNGAGKSAQKLLKNAEMAEQINKLQENLRLKSSITIESVIQDFVDAKEKAMADRNHNAVIKALQEIAKIHGFYEKNNRQKWSIYHDMTKGELVAKTKKLIQKIKEEDINPEIADTPRVTAREKLQHKYNPN